MSSFYAAKGQDTTNVDHTNDHDADPKQGPQSTAANTLQVFTLMTPKSEPPSHPYIHTLGFFPCWILVAFRIPSLLIFVGTKLPLKVNLLGTRLCKHGVALALFLWPKAACFPVPSITGRASMRQHPDPAPRNGTDGKGISMALWIQSVMSMVGLRGNFQFLYGQPLMPVLTSLGHC